MQSAASEELFMEPNAEVQLSCLNIGINFLEMYLPVFKVLQDWQMRFETNGRLIVSRRSSWTPDRILKPTSTYVLATKSPGLKTGTCSVD